MPKPKGLFNHVKVEVAKGQRVCHRHKTGAAKHPISVGEVCLVIEHRTMGKQSYCINSAAAILDQSEADLAALRAELDL
jgi:hypothetical protein